MVSNSNVFIGDSPILLLYPHFSFQPSSKYLIRKRLIEEFQHGEIPTFIAHIETGVRALKEPDGKAILIFSG